MASGVDLLVVGLGNPGSDYEGSRHNVGVEVLDALADRHGGSFRLSKRERARLTDVRVGGRRMALAFPQTFMNNSGEAVAPLLRRYDLDPSRLLVVHDELDLEPGRMKLKIGGGLAGHNGLRSIKAHLHTDEFMRLRIGVGKPPHKARGVDHVLKRIPKAVRSELDLVVEEAADIVEKILAEGPERAMEQANRRP
jgi:PTH1 family peptidyl-tRNA hydrolase